MERRGCLVARLIFRLGQPCHRVKDTDGDFLLIEAANSLPKWVTPGNAENRVRAGPELSGRETSLTILVPAQQLWLYHGHLCLLPLTIQSPASSRPHGGLNAFEDDTTSAAYLSPTDALAALRSTAPNTYRAPEIERDVWVRIDRYPRAMETHCQKVVAYLPKEVAKALRTRPSLVQRAVEGFYVRDPAQLRVSIVSSTPTAPLIKIRADCVPRVPLLSCSG